MLQAAEPGGTALRAWLRIGGHTIAHQQLRLVLALGCERVVCLARGAGPELLELQRQAEAAGAQFHIISSPRSLSSLVVANDELVVLEDGLFCNAAVAQEVLGDRPHVLVQAVETGIAAGFERLDLNHASAGAFRVGGAAVEQLADLPVDFDVFSSLQRIALQAGVAQRSIDASVADGTIWALVKSDAHAQLIEAAWLRTRLGAEDRRSPGFLLVRQAARSFGLAILDRASGVASLPWAAAITVALAGGAAWFDQAWLGMVLCGIAWFVTRLFGTLEQATADRAVPVRRGGMVPAMLGWTTDAAIVIVAGLGAFPTTSQPLPVRLYPAFMLIALLRLAPRLGTGRWMAWLEDRLLLCLALAAALVLDYGAYALLASSAGVATVGLVLSRHQNRIT